MTLLEKSGLFSKSTKGLEAGSAWFRKDLTKYDQMALWRWCSWNFPTLASTWDSTLEIRSKS